MLAAKALAGLLLYPDRALIDALPEIAAILREAGLPERDRDGVVAFCEGMAATDLLDAQATYIALFDRTPSLSLYLFGHVHGDSRERGQAMADLVADYNRMGLELTGDELPDFIPVFLEFASLHGEADARSLIGEIADVVALLAERLERRDSPYAAVLRAVEALGGRRADRETVEARLAEADPADTPEALDAQYEEAPVDFMEPVAADSPCSKAAALVQAFSRDPPPRTPQTRAEEDGPWIG